MADNKSSTTVSPKPTTHGDSFLSPLKAASQSDEWYDEYDEFPLLCSPSPQLQTQSATKFASDSDSENEETIEDVAIIGSSRKKDAYLGIIYYSSFKLQYLLSINYIYFLIMLMLPAMTHRAMESIILVVHFQTGKI